MTILICIGSSCQEKGSRQVVEKLQKLIRDNNLGDKVKLRGLDCMGRCEEAVCVAIDTADTVYSVSPDTVDAFFTEHILHRA